MPKVTDPQKMVTDPALLRELERQGIDKDYVEFTQDYAPRSEGKKHSPNAKFYRDHKSGKEFMVVSGLPMVNATGNKVEVGWETVPSPVPPVYRAKNNVFHAEVIVQKNQITYTCRNNQPSGEKQGNAVGYRPQLFLDGIEVLCGNPTLLLNDPLNPNYHQNTIEWDYGICKRRLRVIEGRIHGYWIFAQSPNGEVRIKYNQSQPRLKLSGYAINDDEERITATEFAEAEYPLEIGDSATYYPDAHVETTSVDGVVQHIDGAGLSWANIIAAAGTAAIDDGASGQPFYYRSDGNANEWDQLYRSIFLFDSSGLPDGAVISAAVLSLYGIFPKADPNGDSPNVNIYETNPASNDELVPGDFEAGVGKFGSTPFATAIAYADWKTADPFWNDFIFNAAGRAAISKTGVSKFGTRNANYDVAATPPNWVSGSAARVTCYYAEQGVGFKPKLVVTYEEPGLGNKSATMGAKMIAGKLI